MEKVLFISNSLFINPATKNGGVKICTFEFIHLLKTKYDVELFSVEYNINTLYKIRQRIGLNIYNDYEVEKYQTALQKKIIGEGIKFVFLNLSNTIVFAPLLKSIYKNIKIILCSHGNETGDLLHDVVRSNKKKYWFNNLLSSYAIGALLKKETFYRINYIDFVLTISEIEDNIEKWIGAKNTVMVPRTIDDETINWKPILNRVGFFGDLSHSPNYLGIVMLCDELKQLNNKVEFRLIGGPKEAGETLATKYNFITYLGYLSDDDLKTEVSSWSYFLNVVFYYSRGVSTKLAKALSFGLPTISTAQGNRGYKWHDGILPIANSANEMASMISMYANDINKVQNDFEEVKKIKKSSPSLSSIMKTISDKLDVL